MGVTCQTCGQELRSYGNPFAGHECVIPDPAEEIMVVMCKTCGKELPPNGKHKCTGLFSDVTPSVNPDLVRLQKKIQQANGTCTNGVGDNRSDCDASGGKWEEKPARVAVAQHGGAR